ncbi:MAG: hypothetical protein U0800_12685 [Isosphaeraceae bacterium]
MAGTLDEILKGGPNGTSHLPTVAQPDESELPDPGAPYQAHARAANKPVYTLHCLLGAEGCRSFQYVQLDSNSEFKAGEHGQIIKLRFAGTKIWEITITGLNLWRLYDGIHRHVIPWVRKSDRGFAAGGDGETSIMGISIKEIEREAV